MTPPHRGDLKKTAAARRIAPMTDPNKNLWAPWRLEYIRELDARHGGCFLCDYWACPQGDPDNLVLWRTGQSLVLLNRFPYTNGHLLIAPGGHVAGLDGLDAGQMLDLLALVRDAQQVLGAAFGAQGFNVGANFGHCAGAGLPGHLHFHVVPRWAGDTNYMAVLGDVRVIPQALDECLGQLRRFSEQLGLPRDA